MGAARVLLIGCGARTAIGMTAMATAAAVRARYSGFGEHPFVVDTAGSLMVVARAPYLSDDVALLERLVELVLPAVDEAVEPLVSVTAIGRVATFIGLPSPRPGRSADLGEVPDSVHNMAKKRGLNLGRIAVIEGDHAAGLMAVKAAWEAINSGAAEFAIAGGVDSYIEPETLEWLESNDQVHASGPDNNPYGFIPGEASGFVLLASAAAAQARGLTAALEVSTVESTFEEKSMRSGAVCTGEGLTALFRRLSGDPVRRAHHMYCDMNGEPYRADEYGFALVRAGDLMCEGSSFTAPADCWGDVGAASGPLFFILADAAVRKGYAPGPIVAGFTSAETGERCGFVVRSLYEGDDR